jgi:hypothetical protein
MFQARHNCGNIHSNWKKFTGRKQERKLKVALIVVKSSKYISFKHTINTHIYVVAYWHGTCNYKGRGIALSLFAGAL